MSQCIKAVNTTVSPLLGKSRHCWVSFGGGEHQSLQHCPFYHHSPLFHPSHRSISSVETKMDALWRWFGTPAVHNIFVHKSIFWFGTSRNAVSNEMFLHIGKRCFMEIHKTLSILKTDKPCSICLNPVGASTLIFWLICQYHTKQNSLDYLGGMLVCMLSLYWIVISLRV